MLVNRTPGSTSRVQNEGKKSQLKSITLLVVFTIQISNRKTSYLKNVAQILHWLQEKLVY